MANRLQVDGDTWHVTADGHDATRNVLTVVFHCQSDSQRPYRVVQVPSTMLDSNGVDAASDEELADLFRRSHTMDFSHDPAASPESHGYGDPPLT